MFKKRTQINWIVAFLGNPGPKFAGTRHNAGFIAADEFEKLNGVKINKSKFKALTAECDINGEKVLLMKPQTYMNLSGDAVGQAAGFYKVEPGHVIVLSDEMALPVGRIRVRGKGSSGGHNGLKSIISALGTEEFPRIRLGVGEPPHPDYDPKDWVLSTFKNKDCEDIHTAAVRAAEAVSSYITDGLDRTMNKFN